jgi:hypothetical protein
MPAPFSARRAAVVSSVYIPLLFPAMVRASATGFCCNIGRLFTGSIVFFIGALVTLLGGYGNARSIFSFIFPAGLLVTWFAGRMADRTSSGLHDPAQ